MINIKTIRDKLKESNIKITELSFYLGVSRPTLYNLLEMYTNKDYKSLEKKVFDLLTFIDNTKPLTMPILMNYMINNHVSQNVSMDSDDELTKRLKVLQSSNSENDLTKLNFINIVTTSSKLDFIIDDLLSYIENDNNHTVDGFIKTININKGDKKNAKIL